MLRRARMSSLAPGELEPTLTHLHHRLPLTPSPTPTPTAHPHLHSSHLTLTSHPSHLTLTLTLTLTLHTHTHTLTLALTHTHTLRHWDAADAALTFDFSARGTLRVNTTSTLHALLNVPAARVAELQRAGRQVAGNMVYRANASHGAFAQDDAIDVLVKGLFSGRPGVKLPLAVLGNYDPAKVY